MRAAGQRKGQRLHPRARCSNGKHFRDCHIEPDWLPIYKIDAEDLHRVRTGTHSDLF